MATKKREVVTIYGVNVDYFRGTVTARIESTEATSYGTGWRTLGKRLGAFGYSAQLSASEAATEQSKAIDLAAAKVERAIGVLENRISQEREKLAAIRALRDGAK